MKGLLKYMASERESAQGPFLLMHILYHSQGSVVPIRLVAIQLHFFLFTPYARLGNFL